MLVVRPREPGLFRESAQSGKNMIEDRRSYHDHDHDDHRPLILFDSVWLCWGLSSSRPFKSHWERMTLVSNFSSRIIIDSSFSITPNLSESCGNPTKEILEGLHADRVYRSYFELEVSLLNGKKQTYSDITCRATLGRIIIQYLWTEMHQTPSSWWIGPVCWIIAFTGHGMVGESPKAKLA